MAKDSANLWTSFRAYGGGQAKLTYLKLKDLNPSPTYVDLDAIDSLANEDIWDEFLNIELGHWDKKQLTEFKRRGRL
ncbi:MAG: hypothetical protein GKR87_04115 [Kiritimatiellae bacterium]|nr:hypothetical protein [Kiritimatiellia bacterium]